MAVDKAVDSSVLDGYFDDIADAIRSKDGTQNTYTPAQMPTAIENIPTGGGSHDWSAIGYSSEPAYMSDAYDYAVEIKENWDSATTSMGSKYSSNKQLFVMPLVDTSNVTNMYNTFNNSNIQTIPLLNTSKVTNFGQAFYNTPISEIPLLDTSSATNMASMFSSCPLLETVPVFNTQNVTSMNSMFSSCIKLKSVPFFNTESVTDMGSMFMNCQLITTIPLLNTSEVTTMNQMFRLCTSLTEVPALDTSNVKDMKGMFQLCTYLRTVPVLDTSNVRGTNLQNMFNSCSFLSNESLNNVMRMCINATQYTGTKKLTYIGLSNAQIATCQTLSNYQDFLDAGWTA